MVISKYVALHEYRHTTTAHITRDHERLKIARGRDKQENMDF